MAVGAGAGCRPSGSRRRAQSLVLVASAAGLLTGCGSATPGATSPPAAQPTTPTVPGGHGAPAATTTTTLPDVCMRIGTANTPASTSTAVGAAPGTTGAPTTLPTVPPYNTRRLTVPLVDKSRPTISMGTQISDTRALTTIVILPVAPGLHPLIVFAAGYSVGPTPYIPLITAWAQHGYIVAAPEFPLTDEAVAGANLDENDINNQPADVRFVADSLIVPGGPLAGCVDPSRVAIAGHSDGGETVLQASVDPVPAGEPPFKAVIAMSVQPLGPDNTDNPPILVTQGTADTINDYDCGVQTYDQAASPKYFEALQGGGHLGPLRAGSAFLSTIEATTEAFLDAYVAGDGSPSAIVAAANAPPRSTGMSG